MDGSLQSWRRAEHPGRQASQAEHPGRQASQRYNERRIRAAPETRRLGRSAAERGATFASDRRPDDPAERAVYRTLLHVGLPKTATTSLQCNVLMALHEQRRINFLGRAVRDGVVHDPLERLIDRVKAGRLSADELQSLRSDLRARLDPRRLNVVSNERIVEVHAGVGCEPTGEDGRTRLRNLGALFEDCDATLLITLRSPVDFAFSWYVEQYYWRFHRRDDRVGIGDFFAELLRQEPERGPWTVFFYDAWIRAAARIFGRVEVLLYEDLEHDRRSWFRAVARLLPARPEEIESLFLQTKRNTGRYTASGKLSKRLNVRRLLAERLPSLLAWGALVRPRLARAPFALSFLRRVLDLETPARAKFAYPDTKTRLRLQARLGLKDDYLSREHGVSEAKLARYGYLAPTGDLVAAGRRP